MKKVIDGKLYDTQTAEEIASWQIGKDKTSSSYNDIMQITRAHNAIINNSMRKG